MDRVTQAYDDKPGASFLKFLIVLAQLRHMLAAENSAIMAQKHYHRRATGPQRAKAYGVAVEIGQRQVSEFAAERCGHGAHSQT